MKTLNAFIGYCFSLTLCGVAMAQSPIHLIANFDALPEGFQGLSFTDGGIRFFNLDTRFPGATVPPPFAIQASIANLPGFTPPHYLSFQGYSPGTNSSFGFTRFGAANMGFSGIGSFASIDTFGFSSSSSNTLTLEALLGGSVVSSDKVTFYSAAPFGVIHRPLSVSGMFDSLRLAAAGPDQNGTLLIGLDNVQITLVPEPSGVSLFCAGLVGFALNQHRSKKVLLLKTTDT